MDTTTMKPKVEVISNEMVKPSLPSSSHPQTFTLCSLDQTFPALHIPVVLFYTGHATTRSPQVSVDHIKASLSQTLDSFYPLAGRLLDESTVTCNDLGIPFIHTKVDCNLSDVIASSHKVKLLAKFLPSQELQTLGPRQSVPLAIQVNGFQCGGFVIGCFMLHKLLDIVSLGTFFKHWSALASNRVDGLIKPDFESTINAFPPIREGLEHVFVPDVQDNTGKLPSCEQSNEFTAVVSVKSFIFSSAALSSLRAEAASNQVPAPTRFEALAGFIWKHLIVVATAESNDSFEDKSVLSFFVNMRPRMRPPLPNQSMGNAVTAAVAQSNANNSKLQELVQEIHSALSYIDHKIQTVYQGDNGVEVICRERKAGSLSVMNTDKGLNYKLSSWCNKLNEADFGFGKPTSILPTEGRPPPPSLRNFIIFTDYWNPITGDTGIEAWLVLEEKQMQILETLPHFLSFASPN